MTNATHGGAPVIGLPVALPAMIIAFIVNSGADALQPSFAETSELPDCTTWVNVAFSIVPWTVPDVLVSLSVPPVAK